MIEPLVSAARIIRETRPDVQPVIAAGRGIPADFYAGLKLPTCWRFCAMNHITVK